MTTPRSEPRLAYRRPLLCVAHEVAPGADGPADAELVVAGYSLCYPCGQAFLSRYIDDEPWAAVEILRMFRDGIIDVAP